MPRPPRPVPTKSKEDGAARRHLVDRSWQGNWARQKACDCHACGRLDQWVCELCGDTELVLRGVSDAARGFQFRRHRLRECQAQERG